MNILLYTDRAFLARKHFSIDESSVGMAIAVHPSFKDEKARGVAIFGNSITGEGGKAIITGFPGDKLKVVEAPPLAPSPGSSRRRRTGSR